MAIINLHKEIFNPIYLPLLKTEKRFILLYGGRDSAKSFFAGQKILINTLKYKYYKAVLVRNFHSKIKDSQFSLLEKIIKLYKWGKFFYLTVNPLQITCTFNNNKIIARGLDRHPEALKSIDDPTCIWYEEAIEIPEKAFINSSFSLRNSFNVPLTEIFTFNPENENTFINREFFPDKANYEKEDGNFHYVESIRDDAVILHTTYTDNKFVTEDRKKNLLNIRDPHYKKVYTYGLWGGALKGLIFPEWKVVKDFPEEEKELGYWLDFGYTIDPTAIGKLTKYAGKLYAKEYVYETGLTNIINEDNPQQKSIEQRLVENNISKDDMIFADKAEPKSIRELRLKGYNIIPAPKFLKSIITGINVLKKWKINIDINSVNIIKEKNNYKWKEHAFTGDLINEPIDNFNHHIDGIRGIALYYNRIGVL